MIAIRSISKAFADRVLFRDASALIRGGERVGLVGANGSGKSTLLGMILGRVGPDRGEVEVGARLRIGHLPQEPEAMPLERTVRDLATELPPELAEIHDELERTSAALAGCAETPGAARERLLERVGLLQSRFEQMGGYEIEHRAEEVLFGLGFQAADLGRRASELSGGWLMRIALARLLLVPRDILLLDEPTNHLDLESVLWLQRYLAGFAGTLVLISHDREFLNALVGAVLHIDHGRLTRYTGGYDDFVRVSRARQEQLLAAKRNQDREIERQERFIERFRAKNTKAAQVQSRIKALERMERIEIESEEKTLEFRFPKPPPSGQRVATLAGVAKRFGPKTVYDRLDLAIERGERIALVGPNGAGKSTLLKILAGVLAVDGGEYRCGHNVTVGYYTQYRHDMLDLRSTVLENAQRCGRPYSETFLRSVLGRFLFPGDDVFKPAQVLSGGEKSRLGLVKILLNPPNFLLLDEPTIHLDIDSVDALIEALAGYDGTLVTISHDVHFLRLLVDKVLRIEAGTARAYPGGYSYYEEKRAAELATQATAAQQASVSAAPARAAAVPAGRREAGGEPGTPGARERIKTKAERRAEAEERNRIAAERRRVESRLARVEERVEELEAHRTHLVAALEDPATYAHAAEALRVNRELQQVQRDLDRYEAEWNELVEGLRGFEGEQARG